MVSQVLEHANSCFEIQTVESLRANRDQKDDNDDDEEDDCTGESEPARIRIRHVGYLFDPYMYVQSNLNCNDI